MATKLIVKFTGMMTFVPVGGELVALIPRTGVGSNSKVHQHRPYLIYDRMYAPVDNHPHPHQHPHPGQGHHEILPLGRMQVSFLKASGTGANLTVPPAAVSLRELTDRTIEAQQVGDAPTDAVYAQIRLPGATTPLSTPQKKAKWIFKDKAGERERELTHQLFWERTLAGDSVEIQHRFLGSATWISTVLTAPAGKDIEVEIFHLPSKYDDHKLNKDEKAMHFDAYYDLYATSVTDRYLPYLNEVPSKEVDGESFAEEVRSANTFTCMMSQG